MHFGLAPYSLAFLAGLLSTLSRCVLPIVPILLGSAMKVHRPAPIALANNAFARRGRPLLHFESFEKHT